MVPILEGRGATLRAAQIEANKIVVQFWGGAEDATKAGVRDAILRSAKTQALFDTALFRDSGFTVQGWTDSVIAAAEGTVDGVISRKQNGINLSRRVYRNQALSRGYVDRAINNGMLLGKSPKEIAKDVKRYISPSTPGGASSAAMRLGRTEVLNAYHTTAIREASARPWIEYMKWDLSGSHPDSGADECEDYADGVHYRGGDPGVFLVSDVPAKPHPNCLCYVTSISPSVDEFAKAYHEGKYDSYLNKVMSEAA